MAIDVKTGQDADITVKSRTDGADEVPAHDVENVKMPSAGVSKQATVAVAGTAARFATAATPLVAALIIAADSGNSDVLYVGFSSSSLDTTGFKLAPGGVVTLVIDDLSKVYIDAAVGGDKASCLGT